MKILLFLTFFQVFILHRTKGQESLSCFSCVNDCQIFDEATTPCSEIDDKKYLCISSYTVIGGHRIEQKGCVLDHKAIRATCKKLNDLDNSYCSVCEESFCNSGTSSKLSILLVCITLLVSLTIRLC